LLTGGSCRSLGPISSVNALLLKPTRRVTVRNA
jgi:hypothetical protein